MRWLYLTGVLLLTLQTAQAGHSPPKIVFGVYIQTTGEGQSSTQARPISLPPNGENILIRALPEVTERDIIDVQPDASGAVHLRFGHSGQVDLDAVTAQNQGRIMVVMINGYIVYAPVIDTQISNGELVIPHPLTAQVVQLLQETAKKNVRELNRT